MALHRLPQQNILGITQAIAQDLNLGFDPLDCDYEEAFEKEVEGVLCRTKGKAVEQLEAIAKSSLQNELLGTTENQFIEKSDNPIVKIKQFIQKSTLPKLARTTDEIGNLLNGLNGLYVPAGGVGRTNKRAIGYFTNRKKFLLSRCQNNSFCLGIRIGNQKCPEFD